MLKKQSMKTATPVFKNTESEGWRVLCLAKAVIPSGRRRQVPARTFRWSEERGPRPCPALPCPAPRPPPPLSAFREAAGRQGDERPPAASSPRPSTSPPSRVSEANHPGTQRQSATHAPNPTEPPGGGGAQCLAHECGDSNGPEAAPEAPATLSRRDVGTCVNGRW